MFLFLFNYGLLPQTWEDPNVEDPETHAKGDGDPIDAIEVSTGPLPIGAVVRVKVLGSLALIDEGETDHKIIVLRTEDPHFNSINSVRDLDQFYPGTTDRLVDWLKNYKTSDGKGVNRLKRDEPTTASEAIKIIEEVAGYYRKLVNSNVRPTQALDYFLPQPSASSFSSSTSTSSSSSSGY